MTLLSRLEHRFTTAIPEKLEHGILYVSMEYATAVHRCCCGCGEEVVTPFTPTDWRMDFDGETISLSPSVGSWTLPCRSHYIIKRGQVIEAGAWSEERIEAERSRDRKAKERHYGSVDDTKFVQPILEPMPKPTPVQKGLFARVKDWFGL